MVAPAMEKRSSKQKPWRRFQRILSKSTEAIILAVLAAVLLEAAKPFGLHIDLWVESAREWAESNLSIPIPPQDVLLNLLFLIFMWVLILIFHYEMRWVESISLRFKKGRPFADRVRLVQHAIDPLNTEAREWLKRLLREAEHAQDIPSSVWDVLSGTRLVDTDVTGLKRTQPDEREALEAALDQQDMRTLQTQGFVGAGILALVGTIYATATGRLSTELLDKLPHLFR
jgi:hypothetical protein